jgi:hypothetical protein
MHWQPVKIIIGPYLLLTVFLTSAGGPAVFAQDSTQVKTNIFKRVATDGKNAFTTVVQTYARPFHWQKRDFLRLGGVLLISGATMMVDKPVFEAMQRNQSQPLNRLERVGNFLGQPENNYPFIIALWASGVLINNDWLRDTGIMVITSVTTSGFLQTLGKEAVGRSRPQTGRGPFDYKPFGGANYHSFPSGHTMLSVATAWVLARQVEFVPLKVVFYSMPVITGASRVYIGAHWLSDIVLGSALGIACAESVMRLYPVIKEKNKVAINCVPTPQGLSLIVRF